jgi:sensor histidine kinase YesM
MIGVLWTPIVFSVGSLFISFTDASFSVTFWIIVPLLYLELFFVLATWYVCKSIHLDPKNFANILLRHLISALSMVSLWLLISYGYTLLINYINPDAGYSSYFLDSIYLLTGAGFFLYFIGILFHYTVLIQQQAQETRERLSRSELTAREAQLRALHTSINPHFLFNSLTALSTLTKKEPDQAQKISLQLSEFLRYNLRYEQKQFSTISEELENIENYLAIEQIRLGERLIIDMDVDKDVQSAKTIPFILLPLVENAVKHGIQQQVEGGTLHLKIYPQDEYICIRVRNPVDEEKSVKGMGLGLITLKKRLVAEYGNRFRLKIDHHDSMFTVDLKIPRKWQQK